MLRELCQTDTEVDKQISRTFPTWFKEYVFTQKLQDELLQSLARGPLREVKKWPVYTLNGYKFNTKDHGEGMCTTNYGVCVRGGENEAPENDFYGVLTDIVEVKYTGWPIKKLVLFQCDWYDPTPNQGTKIDKYGIVEIRASKRYNNYDPFIFAQQAVQVYYSVYPEGQQGWLVVIKTKARSSIQSLDANDPEHDDPYQDDSIVQMPMIIASENFEQNLVDEDGLMDELNGVDHLHLDLDEHDDLEEDVEDEDDNDEEDVEYEELNEDEDNN